MLLNQCHSLGIMLLVKANLAYSAIPFSLLGNKFEFIYIHFYAKDHRKKIRQAKYANGKPWMNLFTESISSIRSDLIYYLTRTFSFMLVGVRDYIVLDVIESYKPRKRLFCSKRKRQSECTQFVVDCELCGWQGPKGINFLGRKVLSPRTDLIATCKSSNPSFFFSWIVWKCQMRIVLKEQVS